MICRRKINIQKCFTILGIGPETSLEEAEKAFRDLAEIYHPDNFFSVSPGVKSKAEENFREITLAFEIVSTYLRPKEKMYSEA